MKHLGFPLFITLACGLPSSAQAKILYDNSNITTDIGVDANEANISTVASNSTTFGFTSNSDTLTYELSDDFSLSNPSAVSMVRFDTYSPGNAASIFAPPLMSTDGTMPAGNGIQSLDGG